MIYKRNLNFLNEFVEKIKLSWERHQQIKVNDEERQNKSDCPFQNWKNDIVFPNDKALRTIVHCLYHASYQREEARDIHIRVAYITPEYFKSHKSDYANFNPESIHFETSHPLSITELRRIAPALNPETTILMICEKSLLIKENDTSLIIWGLLDLSNDWSAMVNYQEIMGPQPPNCLFLSTHGSGELRASTQGSLLVHLSGGEFPSPTLPRFGSGDKLSEFLGAGLNGLIHTVSKSFNSVELDKIRDDLLTRYVLHYYNLFLRIPLLAAAQKHGASFIVIKDSDIDDPSTRNLLEKNINIKYRLGENSRQDLLKETLINASRNVLKLKSDEKYYSNAYNNYRSKLQELEKALLFISRLSSIDGAVLFTDRLRVIGFGCEIISRETDEIEMNLFRAKEPQGEQKDRTNYLVSIGVYFYAVNRRIFLRMSSRE